MDHDPPLSVLDLSPVTTATPGCAGIAQQPRSRPPCRRARLHALLGRRTSQSVEHRELRARHHDRPDRRGDVAHARRLRRRDAAQSRSADRRRALQGAGSAVSGTHRSRHRACAGHRSDHLGRVAATAGHRRRRRFSRALAGIAADREQRLSRKPSVLKSPTRCRPTSVAAAFSARLERLQRQLAASIGSGIFFRASFREP